MSELLSYEDLKITMNMFSEPVRSTRTPIIVNDENYCDLYWISRYQNIHRLITHCTHPPLDSFRMNGYVVMNVEALT